MVLNQSTNNNKQKKLIIINPENFQYKKYFIRIQFFYILTQTKMSKVETSIETDLCIDKFSKEVKPGK